MKTASGAKMTVGEFPLYPEQMKRLIKRHKRLREHPLRLAIWYDKDHEKNLYMLQVVDKFPPSDEKGELFWAEFQSTSEFLIADGGRLILSLTSPEELRKAIVNNWPIVKEIRQSYAKRSMEKLYCHQSCRDLLAELTRER